MNPSFRIRGARLLAGYMSAVDAAASLGFSKSKYQKLEAGLIGLSPIDAGFIGELFNTSPTFLLTGERASDRDYSSSRLASILEAAGDRVAPEASKRLVHVRVGRGFRSARGAAKHHGWSEQTYGAHERGSVALTPERLIGYALGFGVRPEYVIFGEEPLEPSVGEVVSGWIDVRAQEYYQPGKPVKWRWLSKQPTNGTLSIVLLEIDGSSLELADMGPIMVPQTLLSTKAITPFGIITGSAVGDIEIEIFDASSLNGPKFGHLSSGGITLTDVVDGSQARLDPLTPLAKHESQLFLGSFIGKISIA